MTIFKQVKKDFVSAFKNKETIKKNILGEIKTKVVLFEKINWDINDVEISKIIKSKIKEIAKTLEMVDPSSEMYKQAVEETNILKEYLPEDISEDIVKEKISNFIKENNLQSSDFGRVMWAMSREFNWRFDNKKLKDIIQSLL